MKTIIQKSLLIASCYYAILLAGCIKNQCNCSPVTNRKFNYTALSATNLLFTIKSDTAFSSNVVSADTVEAGRYGFRFELSYKILACTPRPKNDWINAAYACDCALPQFYIVDSITNISIHTLKDLDAIHLAGADVSDYFKALTYDYAPQKIRYYDALSAGQYNGLPQPNISGSQQQDLYLKTPVSAGQELAFEIRITFASGIMMTAQTKPAFLK